MGQCNGCGSVRNDVNSAHTWDLVRALESASPASCKTPATSHSLHLPKQSSKKKQNPEKRSNTQQIVSYCLGLRTQNPGLREVDLEPSPKRGSDKINSLRPRRKNTTENKLYHTNENPAPREVDLEPSAKRGTDRTEALILSDIKTILRKHTRLSKGIGKKTAGFGYTFI